MLRAPRPLSALQGGLLAWGPSQSSALNQSWHSTAEGCDYVFTLVAPQQGLPPPEGSDAAALGECSQPGRAAGVASGCKGGNNLTSSCVSVDEASNVGQHQRTAVLARQQP